MNRRTFIRLASIAPVAAVCAPRAVKAASEPVADAMAHNPIRSLAERTDMACNTAFGRAEGYTVSWEDWQSDPLGELTEVTDDQIAALRRGERVYICGEPSEDDEQA